MNKLILLALVFWVAPAAAQQRVDETIRTSATGVVRVSNLAGNVNVEGWDRNEIRVTGVLGRGTERLAITGDAEQTEIRVIIPQNSRNVEGTDLQIRVPAGK
ncbi:MAG TPA: hypothetical protein VFI91_12045, partial [Longimicrobiaceae bacterium]|nr:hypothetical protein [Longimicrobiaceae bacterium]